MQRCLVGTTVGECVGSISACATAGFAMESKCHGGQVVLYDTERLLDWSSNVLTHRIATLVDDVFGMDWGDKVREYQEGKKSSKIDEDELKKLQETPPITNERKCVGESIVEVFSFSSVCLCHTSWLTLSPCLILSRVPGVEICGERTAFEGGNWTLCF